jgi:hypothetical protein
MSLTKHISWSQAWRCWAGLGRTLLYLAEWRSVAVNRAILFLLFYWFWVMNSCVVPLLPLYCMLLC